MKWWMIALIVSGIWIVLCIGAAMLFTPGQTNPQLDAKLSEIFGEVMGAGVVFIWAIVFARWKYRGEE